MEARGGRLVGWLLIAGAHAACPDPLAQLGAAEQAVFEGRLDDADAALGEAEAATACAELDAADAARFWLAEGALLTYRGDGDAAADSFRAAARAAGDVWNSNYGASLRSAYEAAQSFEVADGTITLSDTTGRGTHLDGASATYPVTAPAGLHLVQAGPEAGGIDFGQIVLLGEGEASSLTLPPLTPPEPVVAVEEPRAIEIPEPVRRPVGWLAVSGVATGLAVTGSVLALQQNGAIDAATTVDEAQAAHRRQVVYGVGGYTMMGVAATGLVIYVF